MCRPFLFGFWTHHNQFVVDVSGIWDENKEWLLIEWRRQNDYVFYDIKEQLNFTWKTMALKGKIEVSVSLDYNLRQKTNIIQCCFVH